MFSGVRQLRFKPKFHHFLAAWMWNRNLTFLCLGFLLCLRKIIIAHIFSDCCKDWDYLWKKKCLEEFRVCGKYLVSSRPPTRSSTENLKASHTLHIAHTSSSFISSSYWWQRHSSGYSGQSPWNHLWLLPFFHPKDSWLFLQNISRTRLPPRWPPLYPARLSKSPNWSVSVFESIQSVLNA